MMASSKYFIDLIGFAHIESCNSSTTFSLHGHNARLTLSVQSQNDELDWPYVQNIVSQAKLLAKSFDHVILIPKHLVSLQGTQATVLVNGKSYSFPKQDVLLLETQSARIEDIARAILSRLVGLLTSSLEKSCSLIISLEVSRRLGTTATQSLILP